MDSSSLEFSYILSASVPIDAVFGNQSSVISSIIEGNKGLRVGMADFFARRFREKVNDGRHSSGPITVRMEALDEAIRVSKHKRSSRRSRQPCHPYIVERSDFYCCNDSLHSTFRVVVLSSALAPSERVMDQNTREKFVRDCSETSIQYVFPFDHPSFRKSLLEHLACGFLQQQLRSKLWSSLKAVAFVGDGSILPRKSGTSDAPMPSPPAVPFQAPSDSKMFSTVEIDMGSLVEHLPTASFGIERIENTSTVVLSGLLVPKGITLICGGGYHGKSTLLQAIAVGQYDKIPGDGRELCVSLPDAVTVRAEDGRYVNNCNISAFISNLPTPPGVANPLDTGRFSTRDSSGSTSQAANVSEAIELGARALLVDEDISAANFMARDGRMRALVMDESITPLLYRVNGLYNTHDISTVVVVGGVGDWLDVPHNVILLDKYVVFDATAKAQSISRQFSYGHVQYAGRGVVHRLEWDKKGTPRLRRPRDSFSKRFESDVVVSLLDGGQGLVLYTEDISKEGTIAMDCHEADDEADDDEEGFIDASRLGQLLGKKQLFGTGFCVAWILQNAPKNAESGLKDMLKLLDSLLDKGGMNLLLNELEEETEDDNNSDDNSLKFSTSTIQVLESVGYLERPRNFEIGQALTRMRGIRFEEIPMQDDGSEEAARIEEENKKKALALLWAKRRSKKEALSS